MRRTVPEASRWTFIDLMENNLFWEGLKHAGIQLKGVAARHQFLKVAERVYQEWKSIMISMRHGVNRTIYSHDDTII